jgi:hypothetical protein
MGPTAIFFRPSDAVPSLLSDLNEGKTLRMLRRLIPMAVLGVVALAGCSPGVPFDEPFADYTQRRLTVSSTAGNAQASNLAIQTSGPWPRCSQYTSIPGSGPRMVRAVQSYESGTGGLAPIGVGSDPGGASTGAPSPLTPTPAPAPN